MHTPLTLHMLLHFHNLIEPFPNVNSAPAVMSALYYLEDSDLIMWEDGRWQTTPRGKALVNMLCSTPLPVTKWGDPRES